MVALSAAARLQNRHLPAPAALLGQHAGQRPQLWLAGGPYLLVIAHGKDLVGLQVDVGSSLSGSVNVTKGKKFVMREEENATASRAPVTAERTDSRVLTQLRLSPELQSEQMRTDCPP